MHDLARQYTEMWIIFEVFHLQPPPRPTMYSGVGWGCCSDVLEAVMGPSGAKTRYFLLFPHLKHAEDAKIREACKTVRENRIPCTTVLETHRCFDQCLEYGNITYLGHGSGNAKSRTKGVGAPLWGTR